MKQRLKYFLLCLTLLPILSGCRQTDTPAVSKPLCVFVTQIDICKTHGAQTQSYRFTNDAQIAPILHYLRLLDFSGNAIPEDPPAVNTEYEILLTFSNGTQRRYRQTDDFRICRDNAPWENLKPSQGQLLARLLLLLSAEYDV